MCVTYLCSSSLASAGPAVRNPPGAPGAEGQPEGGPEGEGAASDGEAGQCSLCGPCAHPKKKRHHKRSKRLCGLRPGLPTNSVTWTHRVLIWATPKLCKFDVRMFCMEKPHVMNSQPHQCESTGFWGKKSARSISSPLLRKRAKTHCSVS